MIFGIFLDLEREIYELSSLLSDQRMLIETLMQMTGEDRSSIGTASLHTSSFSVNPMNVLMQKMDGIAVGLQLYAIGILSRFLILFTTYYYIKLTGSAK